MKKTLLALLLTMSSTAALAGPAVIGKVDRLYVRLADGVFREATRSDHAEGGTLYADVRFAATVSSPRAAVLAPVPDDYSIDRGDLLEVRVATRSRTRAAFQVAPMPERDRIVAVNAKFFTPLAQNYGRQPAASPSYLSAALASTPERPAN